VRVVAPISMVEGGGGVLCLCGAFSAFGCWHWSVVGRGCLGWHVTTGCDGSDAQLSSVGGGRRPSAPSESFARLRSWPAMSTLECRLPS
jgi:hypothetical protein